MSSFSFSSEPAMWVALVNAVLLVLVNFGVPISNDQKVAIDTLIGAILAILAGIVIRSQVTPVSKLSELTSPAPPSSK